MSGKRPTGPDPARMPLGPEHASVDELGVSDQTHAGKAYRALRSMILRCELRPGDVVQEKMLMQQLEIGRTPIREALLRLAGERLVLFRWNQIQIASISIGDIRDLYEMRLHNERMAARLFLQRLTPQRQEALESAFEDAPRLLEAGRIYDAINLDFEFHSLIYRGSRNAFLIHHLHNLFGHSYRLWWLTHESSEPSDMERIVQSHEPMIDAVRRRDPVALDREMTTHIVNSFERALSVLKGDGVDSINDLEPYDLGEKDDEQHN